MTPARSSGTGADLLDALTRQHDAIVRDIRRRLDAELPSYEALPEPVLDRHVRLSLSRTLESARAGHPAMTERDLTDLAEVGAVQAQAGVPVDDMLRVWRMGIELVVERARAFAAERHIPDDQVLEFVAVLLAWSDVAMVASAAAHRAAEIEMARSDHERRAAFVRGVLLGAMAPATVRIDAEAYGLDARAQYVPVRAHATSPAEQLELERALGLTAPGSRRRGIGTLLEGDVCGFVRARPRTKRRAVGVGPPAQLDGLADSFRLATRALTTATAFGLTGVVDLATLGVRAAVVADRDVTEQLTRRYLEPLATASSGEDIVATLRAFLDCGLRIDGAAEHLFVHPNTVRYRLGRFEELTGVSLRDTTVICELSWALDAALAAPRPESRSSATATTSTAG
jgi:hypothetical protein